MVHPPCQDTQHSARTGCSVIYITVGVGTPPLTEQITSALQSVHHELHSLATLAFADLARQCQSVPKGITCRNRTRTLISVEANRCVMRPERFRRGTGIQFPCTECPLSKWVRISEHNVSCKAGTRFPYIQCQILNGDNYTCPARTGIPCAKCPLSYWDRCSVQKMSVANQGQVCYAENDSCPTGTGIPCTKFHLSNWDKFSVQKMSFIHLGQDFRAQNVSFLTLANDFIETTFRYDITYTAEQPFLSHKSFTHVLTADIDCK